MEKRAKKGFVPSQEAIVYWKTYKINVSLILGKYKEGRREGKGERRTRMNKTRNKMKTAANAS